MDRLMLVCALAIALASVGARADEDKPKEKAKEAVKATPALDAALRLAASAVGAYLYEAHQKVGLLGDAKAKGVYTAEVATRELNVTLALLKVMDGQLGALAKAEVPAAEKKNLAEGREVIALQLKSAEGLKAYWKGEGKDDAEAYTKNRNAAWVKLQAFLRVKKPADKKEKEKKE